MDFEWDREKAHSNQLKHGVDFADAEGEDRFVSLGMDAGGRLLVTVFTHDDDRIRIISSRPASRGERRRYEDT